MGRAIFLGIPIMVAPSGKGLFFLYHQKKQKK